MRVCPVPRPGAGAGRRRRDPPAARAGSPATGAVRMILGRVKCCGSCVGGLGDDVALLIEGWMVDAKRAAALRHAAAAAAPPSFVADSTVFDCLPCAYATGQLRWAKTGGSGVCCCGLVRRDPPVSCTRNDAPATSPRRATTATVVVVSSKGLQRPSWGW